MDITVYDKLYEALEAALNDFNATSGYKAKIAHYPPQNPEFPLVILTEARNQPQGAFYSHRERISSLGYKVDIYAKANVITLNNQKIKLTKQQICRELMKYITDFMQYKVRLNLISNNSFDRIGTQGELYKTTLVFQKNYFENKEYFF